MMCSRESGSGPVPKSGVLLTEVLSMVVSLMESSSVEGLSTSILYQDDL